MDFIKKSIRQSIKGMTHPIGIFVLLQVVWVAVLILWVVLFLSQKEAAFELAKNLGEKEIDPTFGIALLSIGCVLLGIILLGTVMLFVFTQKQEHFLKQQKNFVSSVTHELRSPLASLQLSFETLEKGNLPDDIREKIFTMVGRDINRLLNLIERILISSRLDRGIFELEQKKTEKFNFYDLILNTISQAKHLDQNLQDRIIVKCPKDLTLTLPKVGVNIILENLVENAIKYSPFKSTIIIEASIIQDRILICVEDNGYGLSTKDLRKIFRMFYRANEASKKAIKGTGLGLFIVKSTVKLMGGQIWAESEGVGLGSAFYVSLPFR